MPQNVRFNYQRALKFFSTEELNNLKEQIKTVHSVLHNKSGAGNDFLGWVDLPVDYDKDEFSRIKKAAEKIRNDSDVLIVICKCYIKIRHYY